MCRRATYVQPRSTIRLCVRTYVRTYARTLFSGIVEEPAQYALCVVPLPAPRPGTVHRLCPLVKPNIPASLPCSDLSWDVWRPCKYTHWKPFLSQPSRQQDNGMHKDLLSNEIIHVEQDLHRVTPPEQLRPRGHNALQQLVHGAPCILHARLSGPFLPKQHPLEVGRASYL